MSGVWLTHNYYFGDTIKRVDYALNVDEWKDFIDECEAFSIVFKPRKKRFYVLILEDGFQFIDSEMYDEVVDTWKLLT